MRFTESWLRSSSSYLSLFKRLNQSSSTCLATICSSFWQTSFFYSWKSFIMPSYTSNYWSKWTNLSSSLCRSPFLLSMVVSLSVRSICSLSICSLSPLIISSFYLLSFFTSISCSSYWLVRFSINCSRFFEVSNSRSLYNCLFNSFRSLNC